MCSHSSLAIKLTSAWPLGAGWTLVVLLAVGCANPGPPRAPSLNLPAPVNDLKVQRVGDRVEAGWTTPRLTTEKTAIPGPITAVLCLETSGGSSTGKTLASGTSAATSAAALPCVEVARQGVVPGPAELAVILAPELAAGSPRLLTYRVELRNMHGRSAGKSNAGWALAGSAPEAAGAIQLSARRGSVLVTWVPAAPDAKNGTMELLRRTLAAAPLSAARPPYAHPGVHAPAWPGDANHSPTADGEEVRLGASDAESTPQAGSSPQGTDPGGLMDRTVQSGATYRYVAQRVREVAIAGHALRLFGEASIPATLTYRDVFPPVAPGGLEAVPEGGFTGADGQTSSVSVDLSWEPSPETDLAGYNIYRSGSAGEFVRLNSALIAGAAYRDATVQAGTRYRYRVTAVDLRDNESAPSAGLAVELQP